MTNYCGAKTKGKGTPCKRPAGWGTKHVGEGRCKLHGGASDGRPIIHGRYSFKHREKLQEKMQKFLTDPEPGNLIHELALERALLQDFLDRLGDPLTISIQHRNHVFDMIEAAGRMVERISRILNQTALTQIEVQLLLTTFQDLMLEFIDEQERRMEFVAKFRSRFEGDRNAIRAAHIAISSQEPVE